MGTGSWTARLARVAAGALLVLLVSASPPLREAFVAVERVTAPLLLAAALVLGILTTVRPSRARLRMELRVSRVLGRWGWAAAVLLFLVPVWAHWAHRPPGSAAALGALLGHIPWSDVHQHVEGAQRLLADGAFGAYSERRPLNAALLAVRLALTGGDLREAILLQGALCGLCAWLLARAVAMRRGLFASLAAFAVVLGLARDFVPMAATEPLGIALACLALAILLARVSRERLVWAALGLLALDTALRARPGAQLMVPALMLWTVWVFRARWPRAVAAIVAVAVAGSLATTAVNRLYGSGEATFTTYPAYTIYGLSRYSNWLQARADFGDALDGMGTEKEVSRFLYARALENIRKDPGLFAKALYRNVTRFFGKLPGNLSRVASLRPLFVGDPGPPAAEVVARDTNLAAPVLLLGLFVFLWYLRTADTTDRLFWAAAVVGLLASVPFVYGDAGFRGLASSYPFFAAALGLGLAGADRPRPGRAAERAHVATAAALAVALLVIGVAGPALARGVVRRPRPELLRLADPGALVLVPAASTSVVVSNVHRAAGLAEPRIERRDVARMLEWAGFEPGQEDYLVRAPMPLAVISAYDHAGKRQVLLVGPADVLREGAAYLSVQARPLPASRFLEVVSWRRLDGTGPTRTPAAPPTEAPAEPE